MTRLHLDFETFGIADLGRCGGRAYARHPATEVLMAAYAFDYGPVQQWVPAEDHSRIPDDLQQALLDNSVLKYAWNVPFERSICKWVLGIEVPHEAWRDVMVMSLHCSLPGKLVECLRVMGMPEVGTKAAGTRLINWFSKMRPASRTKPEHRVFPPDKPELWTEFREYNIADVESERGVFNRLHPFDLSEKEWRLWAMDQEINERGIPVNLDLCRNIIRIRDDLKRDRLQRLRTITKLENPNSQPQMLAWLQERGYRYQDLQKGHISTALEENHTEELNEVLRLRQETSRAAVAKFDAVLDRASDSGRMHETMQFMGAARTGRSAGRVIQPQNLATPAPGLDSVQWGTTKAGNRYVAGGMQVEIADWLESLDASGVEQLFEKPFDALAGAVRPVIQAPPGWVFLDCDYKAIENVTLGAIAEDLKILEPFLKGQDPYVSFGVKFYGQPYSVLIDDKKKRTVDEAGSPWLLRLHAWGGRANNGIRLPDEMEATGLLGLRPKHGTSDLTQAQAEKSVSVWRKEFSGVVKFWYRLYEASV